MATQAGFCPPSEGLQKSHQSAQRALALDPNSADALSDLGAETAFLQHDWIEAERFFRRALAAKPADSLNHSMYASLVLWSTKRLEEAQKEQEKSIELDPLNADSRIGLANTLYFRHQYEAAIRTGQGALALNPHVQEVARNLLRPLVITGRVEEISVLLQRFWKEEPDRSFALSMKAWAAGDRAAARRYAQIALKTDKDLDHRALLYAARDDEANLIATFEKASILESLWAIDGAVLDPVFDRYRSSPAFQRLMKKLVSPP
jgi:tetratricopeptide (TPR) repeat protein